MNTIVNAMKTVLLTAVAAVCTTASAYTIEGNVASGVSTLAEIVELTGNDAVTEIVLANSISLPDGTDLDLKGRTVRVPVPYLDADGKVSSNPSSYGVFAVNGSVHVANGTLMGGCGIQCVKVFNSTLRMENVTVTRSNGGLYVDGYSARAALKNCAIVRNARDYGGGMLCSDGSVTVLDGCSLTENRSTSSCGGGGAAEVNMESLCIVNNSVVANNSSTEIGGAFNIYYGKLYLINSTLCGNVAIGDYQGGAVGNNGGTVRAVNCAMVNNYHIRNGEKISDIGLFSGNDVELTSCVYGGIEDDGQVAKATDCLCGVEYNEGLASEYRSDGVMTGNGGTTVSFPHPAITATGNAGAQILYPPMQVRLDSPRWTYFDYSDLNKIVMAYKDPDGGPITALGPATSVPAEGQEEATRITTSITGDPIDTPLIGAAGATDKRYFTVRLGDYETERGNVSGVTKFGDSYAEGTVVTVKAMPNAGWELKSWMLDGEVKADSELMESYSFTVDHDITVTPGFGEESLVAAVPVGLSVTYNGYPQVGVLSGTKYTLTGNTATEIGKYTATATLLPGHGYEWKDGTTGPKSVDWRIVPPPSSDPEPIVVSEECVGNIDLRRPIVVAPGSNDEITYSESQWGAQSIIGSVNIQFGGIEAEDPAVLAALPVVREGLTGEGKTPFTYPLKTGTYAFVHRCVPPENANAFVPQVPVAPVVVAWLIGAENPESVYAYDRGDGEIVIRGEGAMTDFDGCGPWGTDITGVNIGNGVRNVGANAFRGCTKMTHAELPESMEEIGNGAFAGATGLQTIGSNAWDPPYFIGDPFTGVTKDEVVVYVPEDSLGDYESSEDWAPFWSRYQSESFSLELYSYEGVSRKVTVDGEVWHEGTDYYYGSISYGSKVEVTATITDERYLFGDGSAVKTFTWNFWNKSMGIYDEIMPFGADWLVLQRALAGTPLDDLRGAIEYENVDGTNVVTLLKDISTASQADRTLVVTNAAVLDLAGHAVTYGNGVSSVIGVGARNIVVDVKAELQGALGAEQAAVGLAPGWLKVIDTVGGGLITKSNAVIQKLEKLDVQKAVALGDAAQAVASDEMIALGQQPLQAYVASTYYGGGITVMSGSTCIMEGGTVANCYGRYAGGVYNMGKFVLTGGEIAGNSVESGHIKASAEAVGKVDPGIVLPTSDASDGIVNERGAELVITGGKVRDGICNGNNLVKGSLVGAVVEPKVVPSAEPVVEISGGYYGVPTTLDRAWIVEGHEAIPSAEFAGYDKQVIQTPPEVAEARAKAKEEIEKKAGLDMTRSDEMDDLVEEAFEAIDTAYPEDRVETVLAEYLPRVVDQYAKDNPGVPRTLTATGTLDLRSQRELPYGVDTVAGITYSDSTWGRDATPGAVTITQQNLETGKKMAVVENQWGSSEGTAVKLVGQDTTETGLGHKLFHAVRGTVLESFVTFFFSGFERGKPSNPWEAGEPGVVVYIDPGDPDGEPPTGPTLVIDGEGELDPSDEGVAWNDRREEITEIFVASGVVLRASALAGYPNLQRVVFEDPNYRLPNNAMADYYDDDRSQWSPMHWPSDGVYVMQFNGRRKVTAFYDENGNHRNSLSWAWEDWFDPILFSTVPEELIYTFPDGTPIEPITDENDDLQGWKVTLENDLPTPVSLPDNLGFVVIDLNGHDLIGVDGLYDGEFEDSRDGRPAFVVQPSYEEEGEPLTLEFIDSKPDETPDIVGGKGADGDPAGNGGPAIRIHPQAQDGVQVIAGPGVTIKGGDAGTGLGTDVPAGEPSSYGEPEEQVVAIEGGKVEYGDTAEGGVTAWAKCNVGVPLPNSWLRKLPQGVTYVNGSVWLWRRVGDKTGPATFDFNELPLALMVSEGLTSLNIEFVPGTIEVDTLTAPVNFSFRFVGSEGGQGQIAKKVADKGEMQHVVVVGGKTTLVAVSGKSIFELAGEYAAEDPGQQQIIVKPVKPIVVVKSEAAALAASVPEKETAAAEVADPVVVWENLEFTCADAALAADRWGGAIRMEGGAMQVVNCTFRVCFADDYGGAIFAFGLERDSSVTGCRFENCFVDGMYGYGGAIYASAKVVGHVEPGTGVRLMVSSSTFSGNAAVNGGAICTMRDANVDDLVNEQPIELEIHQASFLENAAEYDGGAIFAEGPVTIKGTPFYRNFAGGSGGAIAMDCVVGDWFAPAKLSVGEGALFTANMASNAFTYAFGGAIAHLQPGGELEIFGAKFFDNTAIATGFNTSLAYALGGAVYADTDANVSLEKTRFFGNWAVSDSAYAYGGAGAFATGAAKVTACSFDDNGVAAPDEYYGGALDFAETTAFVKDSTFRGSNVEAVDAYAAELTFTNCVIVGNATLFGDEWSDVYATDSTVDVAWTAYGSYYGEGTSPESFDDAANHNLPESTVDIYDPAEDAEPWLCPTGYVAAAALGLVQDATDIDGVPYGSRFWGYSMGAYECHTMRDMNVGIVVTVDPEEYAWTGLPIEPHSPKVNVYDTIVGSNLVEGVDYTLTWANNVDPTDRAVVTAIGTERDYIFSAFTNFWITAYYVDSYKDDETEPFLTEMFGELSHTNVAAKIAPPKGYAYDPLTSMPTGTVRRYDGECPYPRNGQLTLVMRYYTDESDDDVPDIYQKKMHLKVVNGWWNEALNGADKTYWVTLYSEDGKWSQDGTGFLGENPTNRSETVVLPTAGQRPFTDYSASGKWWYMFDSSEFTNIATPVGLEVRSSSWPFVIFLYDRKNESEGGRGGRGGRGGTGGGTSALAEYKLRAGLKITKFSYEDGKAAGEAWASVVDESTGQTILDELLRRTKIDVLATPSLDKGEWSVIGSPTTDGEGGWGTDERPAAETPAQMFFKLRLR